jgi:hypothetical protein
MFARAPCMCDLHLLACTPRAPPLSRAVPRGLTRADLSRAAPLVFRRQICHPLTRVLPGVCSYVPANAPPGSLDGGRGGGLARLRPRRRARSLGCAAAAPPARSRLLTSGCAQAAGSRLSRAVWCRWDNVLILLIRNIRSTLIQHCRSIDRHNIVATMYWFQENKNNFTTMKHSVTLLQQYLTVFFH